MILYMSLVVCVMPLTSNLRGISLWVRVENVYLLVIRRERRGENYTVLKQVNTLYHEMWSFMKLNFLLLVILHPPHSLQWIPLHIILIIQMILLMTFFILVEVGVIIILMDELFKIVSLLLILQVEMGLGALLATRWAVVRLSPMLLIIMWAYVLVQIVPWGRRLWPLLLLLTNKKDAKASA